MTEHHTRSRAKKLLLEYRLALWHKSALESVQCTGHNALISCAEKLRFTEELVWTLRDGKPLGEKLYWVVYATYMTKQQPCDINEILSEICKYHKCIPRSTYFRLKSLAINMIDNRLQETTNHSGISYGR